MAFVITVLIIGLIPAMIAASKGRNFLLWYIYGCALFIIALVHALIIKSEAQKIIEAKALRQAVGPAVSAADELERFAKLRADGVITDQEFQDKKRAILAAS